MNLPNISKLRINSSQNNLQALIAPREIIDDARFVGLHNKNGDLLTQKEDEEVYIQWKKGHLVPWGTLLDIFIVLLYMFFCLSYQRTKMTFVHNFNDIFNSYFMGDNDKDDDGITHIYFRDDFIEIVTNVSQKFFTFDQSFPSQEKFERSSNLSLIVNRKGSQPETYSFNEKTVSDVENVVRKAADSSDFKGLSLDVDYLITSSNENIELLMVVKYSMTFIDTEDLGFIEWRSRFRKTETTRIGSEKLDQLSSDIFPTAIVVIDSIALIFTITKFFSFFKHAKEYAKKNYISFYRAFMWKVDRWELFDLFYRSLTFIAVIIYITIVDNDFGEKYWLLVLLGVAAFMHTMGLFRSLEMKKELWMVARLIVKATGNALSFFAGFIPLYVGYTFIGIALFGYFCNLFKGFLRSVKILFSIFHSDVVMDTEELIKSLAVVPDWVGNLYIFIWTNLTCGIAINVLIAMVEETLGELIREQESEH